MIIKSHKDRFHITSRFLEKVVSKEDRILDLGGETGMSEFLHEQGYDTYNTDEGIDFDDLGDAFSGVEKYDVVSAFEVVEHLFSPYDLLKKLPADKLVITVPLKLWFAKAYKHVPVMDGGHMAYGHFHEFEPEQMHMLLDKAGWKILYEEKWKGAPAVPLGIRPLLRYFSYRYYALYCERAEPYTTGNYRVTKKI